MTTRDKLLRATQDAVVKDGIAHLSARTVAARADVNQALVFYHFGTVSELVEAAARALADDSVAHYRDRFAGVDSLGGLLALGEEVHAHERTTGNVAVMAQLMAGAQRDEVLARAARYAMDLWRQEVEAVVRRVVLVDVLDDLGPVARRAVTARLRRGGGGRPTAR